MKTKLLWLFVILMITVVPAYAQSKKDIESDYAKCIIAKDSVQKVLTELNASYEALSITYDSLSNVCLVYDTMYNVIKERVFKYSFQPSSMPFLLDSLTESRNEAFTALGTSLSDSITVLNQKNEELKAVIETLSDKEDKSAKIVNDLKQLKELLDTGILTQQEFDTKKALLLEQL